MIWYSEGPGFASCVGYFDVTRHIPAEPNGLIRGLAWWCVNCLWLLAPKRSLTIFGKEILSPGSGFL